MTPQRVTLITLGVDDIDRAKAFYAAMGWTPTSEVEGQVVFYQINGMALGFFSRKGLAKEQNRPVSELGTGAVTLAQNMTTREEVNETYAKAIAAGATPLAAPAPMAWGGYSSYYADPDGHVWETAHNPFWALNPDCSLTLPAENQ